MNKRDSLLYKALIKKRRISKDSLEDLSKQAQESSQPLSDILIKRDILSEEEILGILADELNLSFLDLKSITVDKAVIKRVPLKVASYYKFMPIKLEEKILTIAVNYPLDVKIQDEIRMQLGFDIEMSLSRESDIREMLSKYYGLAADTLEKIIAQVPTEEGITTPVQENIEDIEKLAEDASLIKLVNQIILEAYKKRATDIHIEPYRGTVVLRYRIDGVLYDAKVPVQIKQFLNAIISRIKIMSNLNIVEHRLPQDGRAIVKNQMAGAGEFAL